MDDAQTLKYVESTDLARYADTLPGILGRSELPPLTGAGRQGAVVDSNVVAFADETPVDIKNAVASWLLFAQRAADAKVSDPSKTEKWTDAYYEVLSSTGWVIQARAETWHDESASGFTLYEKIAAVIAVLLGQAPALITLITTALTSLQSMNAESPWITLFDRRGRSAKAVAFQMGAATVDADGGVALEAIDFRVDAAQTMTQVLFFKFTQTRARISRRRTTLLLAPAHIIKLGPAIAKRVEEFTLDSIAAYDLAKRG